MADDELRVTATLVQRRTDQAGAHAALAIVKAHRPVRRPVREWRTPNPRLMDRRMVCWLAANAPRTRRHLSADFAQRRGSEAKLMWTNPAARKNVVPSQNPATRIIARLAIDGPDRQTVTIGLMNRVHQLHRSFPSYRTTDDPPRQRQHCAFGGATKYVA